MHICSLTFNGFISKMILYFKFDTAEWKKFPLYPSKEFLSYDTSFEKIRSLFIITYCEIYGKIRLTGDFYMIWHGVCIT